MAKYFILHHGKHKYSHLCANCGRKREFNDSHISLEIVKIVTPSCDECSPDYEGRRPHAYYLSGGSQLMHHGIKHPDGSWNTPFFRDFKDPVPAYVRRNAVNLKEND